MGNPKSTDILKSDTGFWQTLIRSGLEKRLRKYLPWIKIKARLVRAFIGSNWPQRQSNSGGFQLRYPYFQLLDTGLILTAIRVHHPF